MYYCSSCQYKTNNEQRFCPRCGSPLITIQETTNPILIKKRTPGKGFAITSLVLGIIAISYALFLCNVAIQATVYKQNPLDREKSASYFDSEGGFHSVTVSRGNPNYNSQELHNAVIKVSISGMIYPFLGLTFGLLAFLLKKYRQGIAKAGIILNICTIVLVSASTIILLSVLQT